MILGLETFADILRDVASGAVTAMTPKPFDPIGLAVLGSWPVVASSFRGCRFGTQRIRDGGKMDTAKLSLRLALAGTITHPLFRPMAALQGIALPPPGEPLERATRWGPFQFRFDDWMENRFVPAMDGNRDPSLRGLRQRWLNFMKLHGWKSYSRTNALKAIRGAVKRAARRNVGNATGARLDARKVWEFAVGEYLTPEEARRLGWEKAVAAVADRLLLDLRPKGPDDKKSDGFMQIHLDGSLDWNYSKAADRLMHPFKSHMKRRAATKIAAMAPPHPAGDQRPRPLDWSRFSELAELQGLEELSRLSEREKTALEITAGLELPVGARCWGRAHAEALKRAGFSISHVGLAKMGKRIRQKLRRTG
jgi:hypothetical protein